MFNISCFINTQLRLAVKAKEEAKEEANQFFAINVCYPVVVVTELSLSYSYSSGQKNFSFCIVYVNTVQKKNVVLVLLLHGPFIMPRCVRYTCVCACRLLIF